MRSSRYNMSMDALVKRDRVHVPHLYLNPCANDCQPLTSQSEAMTLSKEKKSKLEHRIEGSRGTHQ